MNPLYTVSQSFLQTAYLSSSIQSMQAMMMGLYPSSDLNTLNEWQQGNAIPPVEGADFSQLQSELGASALPYGLNTFPIQQWGLEDDFVLAVSSDNCPLF